MQKFEYSFLYKLFYRFGNIPVTLLLVMYLFVAATNLDKSLINMLPLVISALLIFFLNRHYLKLYKILPYKIEADNERLICSNFLFSKKEIVIYHKDISTLTGGVFEGRISGIMKLTDDKNNLSIGFFNSIKNAHGLQTIILSRVPRNVYDEVVKKLKQRRPESFNKEKSQSINNGGKE